MVRLKLMVARALFRVSSVDRRMSLWLRDTLTRRTNSPLFYQRVGLELHRFHCLDCQTPLDINLRHHPSNWPSMCDPCMRVKWPGLFEEEEVIKTRVTGLDGDR